MEQDTEEAFEKRRELVKLLVEKIALSRNEDGRTKVDITYRFEPPERQLGEDGADSRLRASANRLATFHTWQLSE